MYFHSELIAKILKTMVAIDFFVPQKGTSMRISDDFIGAFCHNYSIRLDLQKCFVGFTAELAVLFSITNFNKISC